MTRRPVSHPPSVRSSPRRRRPTGKWWRRGQDADRQIAEARQLAQRAETVGVILTAPDLIRFNLTSAETNGSSAQLLWSRTRGLVLSGSRLPAAPPESTYQLWLVTSTQSVGAGVFFARMTLAGRRWSWMRPPESARTGRRRRRDNRAERWAANAVRTNAPRAISRLPPVEAGL